MRNEGSQTRGNRIVLPEPLEAMTESIIGGAYEVFRHLGAGLIEQLYENALALELELRRHRVERQVPAAIDYKGSPIGTGRADMLVDGEVVVELKSVEAIVDAHLRQTFNYVTALNRRVGLVINFGSAQVGVRRVLNFPLLDSA